MYSITWGGFSYVFDRAIDLFLKQDFNSLFDQTRVKKYILQNRDCSDMFDRKRVYQSIR